MLERLRSTWATAWSTPWRRAPILLLRRPGVLAAVAGATAVVVAAVASVPLFLSSAGSAAIALQVEERCPRDTGVRRGASAVPAEVRDPGTTDLFAPLAGRLGPTNTWAAMDLIRLAGTEADQVTVLARDGFADHVDVLEETGGPGIWITDRAAERTGLALGDMATIGALRAPVAAVYRDLAGFTLDRYWCSNVDELLIKSRNGDLVLPPPIVLVDRETLAAMMEAGGHPFTRMYVEAPLDPDLTRTEARALIDELACHGPTAGELAWCADGQPLLRRPGFVEDPGRKAVDDVDFVRRYFTSSLPFVLDRSQAIQTAVGSGIWPVATFAALAGTGLVAAAASLWFDRRRRDVVLLSVRGVSSLGLGIKAVLELAPALLGGAAAGVAVAYGAVAWLGPSSSIEPVAVGQAGRAAALGLLGAVAMVVGVVAARTRTHAERSGRRRWLASVPWELGLVAATVVSYRRLGEWGVPVGQGADVSTVDVWGLLFPVLFLLTCVAVVSRVLAVGLRPLRRLSARWPTPAYLAVRRVARSKTASLGLVAATALAAGVLVYAATMDRSLQTSLAAKAETFVGSQVALGIGDDQELPPELDGRATVVTSYRDAWVDVDGRESVSVIAIDPETFEDAAFWDDTFAGRSLGALLDDLRGGGEVVPVITTNLELDGPHEMSVGQGIEQHLTVEGIAAPDVFPGMKRGKPTVFVRADALDDDLVGGHREVWVDDDHDATVDLLSAAGVPFEEVRRVGEVVDGSSFVTVSWTFGFMRSLGVVAGLLAIGGVAVHLDARRRERVLGHAFLRRMGMAKARHRRALAIELVASVLVGCWIGVVAAVLGAGLAHGRIDPVPFLRPAPLFRVSLPAVLVSAVGAVVIVVLAAALAQRRAEGDDPVEVLRAGA